MGWRPGLAPVTGAARLDLATAVKAPVDHRLGHKLDVPKLLAGRLPGPARAGEVAVDQIAAASLHLRVGARLNMVALGNELPGRPGTGPL